LADAWPAPNIAGMPDRAATPIAAPVRSV